MSIEKFIGSYTSRPFWAGAPLDFARPETFPNFFRLMSEQIFCYQTETFALRVCKDGMLMLQAATLEAEVLEEDDKLRPTEDMVAWWGWYLDHVNSLHLLLESAVLQHCNLCYFELSEVTQKDAFRIRVEDREVRGYGFPSQSVASFLLRGRCVSSYPNGEPAHDPQILMRRGFPQAVFDTLADNFGIAASHSYLIAWFANIARSLAQYKVGNYNTALMLAWFVIEAVVNLRWDRFLDGRDHALEDGKRRINSDRRERLRGRDYPISVVSNLLELSDVLRFVDFERVNRIRVYRNKVAHQDEKFRCGSEHCEEAIQLALALATEGTSITMHLNFSYSIHGL